MTKRLSVTALTILLVTGAWSCTATGTKIRPEQLSRIEKGRTTQAQVIFRFALAVGMLPLTGTSDPEHMTQDLASHTVALTADEVRAIETLAG